MVSGTLEQHIVGTTFNLGVVVSNPTRPTSFVAMRVPPASLKPIPVYYAIRRKRGYTTANPIVKTTRRMPLSRSASAVPARSATAAKGSALRGITPNDIIAMLITRPRMSGVAYSWSSVVVSDMKTAPAIPVNSNNGKAVA